MVVASPKDRDKADHAKHQAPSSAIVANQAKEYHMRWVLFASMYLGLVACDTPILQSCQAQSEPTGYAMGVPFYDFTGRVDGEDLGLVLGWTLQSAEGAADTFEGQVIMFVPDPIPWFENGQPTTVMGYYDPNMDLIDVALTSGMTCLLDSALVHELLHCIDMRNGKLSAPRIELEANIQREMREHTEICHD